MAAFDAKSKLMDDTCAVLAKEAVNRSINEYNMTPPALACNAMDAVRELSMHNPNLRYRVGHGGLDACTVDADSEMRNRSQVTRHRGRHPLQTRWDHANPDMRRGDLEAAPGWPVVESRLLFAADTSIHKPRDKLAEENLDVFVPLRGTSAQAVQDVDSVVFPFPQGGVSTRAFFRRPKVNCGNGV